MQRIALSFLLLAALEPAIGAETKEPRKPASFEKVLEYVQRPQRTLGSMAMIDLQVTCRLAGINYNLGYTDPTPDKQRWLQVVLDEDENIYARLCAASFVGGDTPEIRRFLETQTSSDNLRHRYNATEAVSRYLYSNPGNAWATELLLKHMAAGDLDGSGVMSSEIYQLPDWDSSDIALSPLDDVSLQMGHLQCTEAVPVLINILKRKPNAWGAVCALGSMGDPRAIPVLISILKKDDVDTDPVIEALAQLKAKEAVPVLVKQLKKRFSPNDDFDTNRKVKVLEALCVIGDKRAVKPIRAFVASKPEKRLVSVAKRVLAQLDSDDPVGDLSALYDAETDEFEKRSLLVALIRYPQDRRVFEHCATMAQESPDIFLRLDAIRGLEEINSKDSLLVLASLLNETFPSDWDNRTKFMTEGATVYCHEEIHRILKERTGKDLPPDPAAWKKALADYAPEKPVASVPSPAQ